MENLATTKQINFIKSLNPQLTIAADLTKIDASKLISKLLKENKANKKSRNAKTTKDDVKNPFSELKRLKVITDEDVKNAYFESINLYAYRELKKAKANGSSDKLLKYYKKDLDSLVLIETNDGHKLLIDTDKNFTIESDLWYSDELDDIPTKSQELFIKENLRHCNFTRRYERAMKNGGLFIINSINGYKSIDYNAYDGDAHDIIRALTDTEMAEFKFIYWYFEGIITQRLVKYWNRYSDKVCIRTYWANR